MNAATPPLLTAHQLVLANGPPDDPFDFSLAQGERCLIHGQGGAGKTLLVRTLLGLDEALAGRIRLFGHDLETLGSTARLALRASVGVLFAEDGLIPAWSGYENLALPLRYHGLGDEAAQALRLEAAIERYGLPPAWLDLPVAGLGAPRRAMLALVRALLPAPRLLVTDDPPLEAMAKCGAAGFGHLLTDVLEGPHALLCLHAAPGGFPLATGHGARWRRGSLQGGRLHLEGGATC